MVEEEEEEETPVIHDDADGKEAEDPAVLKELVKLINKAGGIANLEKQLLIHKNGSVVYRDPDTQQISTTPAPISASLYDKILARNKARKEYQPIKSRQNFASSTENVIVDTSDRSTVAPSTSFRKEYQPIRTRQQFASSTENIVDEEDGEESSTAAQNSFSKQYQSIRSRQNFAPVTDSVGIASTAAPSTFSEGGVTYTGFSFNSRSGPQNQGIEQLDEFGGSLKEKPKYTVLSRNKAVSATEEEIVAEEDEEDIIPETTTVQRGIYQNKYVNLQRRPLAGSQSTSRQETISDKVDFTGAPLDAGTTIRPFTAAAPRGFASRYDSTELTDLERLMTSLDSFQVLHNQPPECEHSCCR